MNPLTALIGKSPALSALRSQVERLLAQPAPGRRLPPLLIQGESGVGKGLLARAIHRSSARAQGPWVDINCGAIPETLIESELFGVERGAFTDARERKAGLFQTADRGVLFLDEVGNLPLTAQAKLLAAVEQRQVRRLGSSRPEAIDVWIVSATNEELDVAVREKRFRADLYHRLAGVTLRLPPLRERGADVLDLAEHYLAAACAEYGAPPKRLSQAAQAALCAHAWPGNVRELANLMERVALLSDAAEIGPELLSLPEPAAPRRNPGRGAPVDRSEPERETLLAALEATGWSLSRAAARLGMPRSTLRYRMERHDLRPGERAAGPPPAQSPTERLEHPSPASTPAGPTALRWERCWVTALECVLTPLDGAAPIHAGPTLEILIEKLQGFGAQVEGLHSRGLRVLFGLEPAEDGQSRAVHAAWATQRAVQRLHEGVGVTCAIETRECVVGRGGTVVGLDPAEKQMLLTGLERLARLAAPPSVMVGAAAARFLERRFELEPAHPVAGDAAADAYRVVGRVAFRGGTPAAHPLRGRDRDLAALDDLLAKAEEGRGQAVGLSGEPGIGKSRLLYEFRGRLDPGRICYVEGRCASYGRTIPYLPVLDLVQQHFSLADTDAPGTLAEKIETGLRALRLDAATALPYLLHLLGVKADTDGPLGVLNPETVKVRTIDALRQVTVARSRARLVVIAIEDMHWIDHASEEALAALVESAAGCRMLLLCTYRPGYHPPWLAKSYASQLVLGGLSRRDSAALVDALATGRPAPSAELTDEIVARADGNPFFLEELARATFDRRAGDDAPAVPDTIQGVLSARINRLPPAERHVLEGAALLGKDFAIDLLRGLVARPELEFEQTLAHLQASEFLVETSATSVPTCAFRHGLTQEVAYRGIPGERRQRWHADAAAIIERLAPDVAAQTPEVLAHHYAQAGLRDQALSYWHRAGTRAISRSANVEAISHLRQGLALLETLPRAAERDRMELLFLLTLATPLIMVHGYGADEAATLFERARAICADAGDSPHMFPALYGLWRYYFVRANYREAERLAGQIRAIADAERSATLTVAASAASGLTSFYVGRLSDAQRQLEESLRAYDPRDVDAYVQLMGEDPRVPAVTHLTWARYIQGLPDDALAVARTTLAEARAGGHPFHVTYGCHFLAVIHQFQREHDLACRAAEEELALAIEHQFRFFVARGRMIRGASLAQSGRVDEGLDLLREGLDAYRRGGAGIGITYDLAMLAGAYRRKGLAAEALRTVDEALAAVEASGERFWEPDLWRVKGELLAEQAVAAASSPETAEGCLESALRQARDRGTRLLEIRAAVSLARVLARRDRGQAIRLLAESIARVPAADGAGAAIADIEEARAALAALRGVPVPGSPLTGAGVERTSGGSSSPS